MWSLELDWMSALFLVFLGLTIGEASQFLKELRKRTQGAGGKLMSYVVEFEIRWDIGLHGYGT